MKCAAKEMFSHELYKFLQLDKATFVCSFKLPRPAVSVEQQLTVIKPGNLRSGIFFREGGYDRRLKTRLLQFCSICVDACILCK